MHKTIKYLFLLLIVVISCKKEGDKSKESESNSDNTKVENKNETFLETPLFTLLSPEETGINFINYNKENNDFNYFSYEYFYNGGGVAIADFNNDNLQDIVLVANMALNKLYLNKGNLQFQDISNTANINSGEMDWCTGVTVVDINKDGYQDIFISRSGWFKNSEANKLRNLLFINNGDLTFTESGEDYGFNDLSRTTQACFFDKDNDGDLDVYILNHPKEFTKVRMSSSGDIILVDSNSNYTDSDKLYENKNGIFIDKTKGLKLTNSAYGLGVKASDINNDGWQDLYIANDYSKPDLLLINQKNGTFKNISKNALKHMSKFSMGVDIADYNNDGLQDIFTTEMLAKDNYYKKTNMASMNPGIYWAYVKAGYHYQDMHNSLQLNNGNETFSEISWLSNTAETDWSWCPLFADFDNDGFKDLFITNGVKREVYNKDFFKNDGKVLNEDAKQFERLKNFIPFNVTQNNIFKNNRDLTFTDKSSEWGLQTPFNSNGAAYGDLDNDGDLDLVINNLDEKAAVYKNNLDEKENFINIQLTKGNDIPYGTKVRILDQGNFQTAELSNVHGFQSVSERIIHFGLGQHKKIDSLLINWSNGKNTLLTDIEINKTHQIDYDISKFNNYKKSNSISNFIKNANKNIILNYTHKEKEFDDYEREVLLPHKLSQEGPFIDVADVNGDGLEDFFVGNGVGFAGELFLQTKEGKFKKSIQKAFTQDYLAEDLGVLFFDFDNDGDKDLYVVSGSNEHDIDSPYMQDRLYENDGKGNFLRTKNVLPKMQASGSCVKASDFDKDGDLDLFIGGFQIPGKYPKAGTSYLLKNNQGVFKDITLTNATGLQNLGMVKDAIFTDVNADSNIDLVIVGHWMPVSVFINKGNKFENKTKEFNLQNTIGWWNSIISNDFNNDGRIDFIVGNLGLNTKHKASKNQPFKVIAKDFDRNGTNDIALGYYNNNICYPVRGKQCSTEQIPEFSEKIKSYSEFGNLTFDQVYDSYDLSDAEIINATNFNTSLFINQNNETFNVKSLPNTSQFAPTNSFISYDMDNDGNEEIIAVGNHYPIEVETGRSDAHSGNVININSNNLDISSLPLNETGFFNNKDARCIKKITIKNKPYFMVSNNRDKIGFFELIN